MKDHDHSAEDSAIPEIARSVGHLGVGLADVSGHVDDVSAQVQDGARIAEELSRDAHRIATGNQRVIDASSEAEDAARQVETLVTSGHAKIDDIMARVVEVTGGVVRTGEEIAGLRDALKKVNDVAQVIHSIARQTNLLSLNASIEAARAGAAGRGFMVVAQEVKTLSTKTAEATEEINSTLEAIAALNAGLVTRSDALVARASEVREQTGEVSGVMREISGAVTEVSARQADILHSTRQIAADITGIDKKAADLSEQVARSGGSLSSACAQLRALTTTSERLIGATARLGYRTEDSIYIEAVIERAGRIGAALTAAVKDGTIHRSDLFDTDYVEIPGTDPKQVRTRFTDLADRLLPQFQDDAQSLSPKVVFCASVDRNGYLPVHNPKFSKPQRRGETAWNAQHCRNRRIFDDRVGLSAGRNTEPFLLQAYRRDMGGGEFALMKDVSAPIMVAGEHWGGLRLAYLV
ncbi:methyl-accepting chemotaxis protein [Roseovarius aquimarinus]|uniref:Methyl-accepting chemotaxis protein n=1 Tax=Roseovarius aquimarinus TaxID=1229156 RepID=A0ABW7IAT3_9RHOB